MRRAGGPLWIAALVLAAAETLLPSVARAHDPLTLFGFGARAEGLGGALTADASGHAAAFHNPAGVARGEDVEVAIGYGYGIPFVEAGGSQAHITTPRGVSLGLAIPAKLGPLSLGFGVALYVPDQFIVRIYSQPVATPRLVLLDNSPDRIVAQPVVALRPVRWLSLGGGATLLADAAGNGIDLDVGLAGGQKTSQAGLDVTLPIRAAPVAGLTVEPARWLRLGLSYRGAIDLGVRIDVAAHVDIAGAVQGTTAIALRAINYYTPRRLALGAAVDLGREWTAMAEVAWSQWSAAPGPFADLRVDVSLGVVPPLVPLSLPVIALRDTFAPKAGVEFRRAFTQWVTLDCRLGLGYEPSPVPDQPGLSTLLDSDRLVMSTGVGVVLTNVVPILGLPLRLAAALGWHELLSRAAIKEPAYAGTDLSSSGRIIHLSTTLEARF